MPSAERSKLGKGKREWGVGAEAVVGLHFNVRNQI